MSQDVEIHLIAYDEASSVIQQCGSNLSSTFTDIEGNTQNLVTTTDDATNQIADDYNQVNNAGQNLQNSQSDVQNSCGQSVMAVNNLALSGAALAMSFMNVENREVAVDRANLMVQRSTETLQKAQDDYNKVVAQYGVNSSQAQAALDKLNIAEDAHNVAVERADMAQRNLSMSMVTAALTVIPSLISMITTISHATEIWEGIQETMNIVMDANPIFLVIAAVGGLIAALILIPGALNAVIGAFEAAGNAIVAFAHDIGDAWNGFVSIFTGGNKSAEDSLKTLSTSVDATSVAMEHTQAMAQAMNAEISKVTSGTPEATAAIAGFEDQLSSAQDVLYASNEILTENVSTISGYTDQSTAAGDEATTLNNQITDLNKAYQTEKDSLDQQIATIQSATPSTQQYGRVTGALTEAQQEAADAIDQLNAKEVDLKNQLDGSVTSLQNEQAALVAQQTAAKNSATELTNLTTKYDDLKASADTNLGAVKAAFDNAFNAGDMNKALGIVQDFATQYGLSLSDAEKIIDAFNAAQATIPQTMEEQLLIKAQNDFADFQKCMSGKAYTLQTDVTGKMGTMADDITALINSGLVGQAQTEMASYVSCNTSKVASMVTAIQQDMTDLTTQHNAQIKQMSDYAATLTGAEKVAVLDQIDQMTTRYEAKMANLQGWLNQLLGQMVSDSAAAQASIAQAAESAAARVEASAARLNTAMARSGDSYTGTVGSMATATAAATMQITSNLQGLTDNMIAHAQRLQDTLVGRSVWTDMLAKMEDTTAKSVAKIRAQFQSLQAGGIAGGGFGAPEALPGAGGKAQVVNITLQQPLVNIEGSADKATVDLASKQVLAQLKSIIVEPTSVSAPATQRRIRKGAVMT